MKEHIRDTAEELIRARKEARIVTRPSKRFEAFDLQAGYEVGSEIQQALEEQGYRPVGRKIGFTNRDTWKEFNLDTPIWAPVYEQTVIYAGDRAQEVNLAGMTAPRIEPEIVFGLASSIEGKNAAESLEELFACLEWVAMGFEIVDCHYPGWEFTVGDIVADFGAHAMLVIGKRTELAGKDFRSVQERLRSFEVLLKRNGEVVAAGKGENALGSPLVALHYLTKLLVGQKWAKPLLAGEVVTTGTLTPLPYVHPGEQWSVEPEGMDLEPLELKLY